MRVNGNEQTSTRRREHGNVNVILSLFVHTAMKDAQPIRPATLGVEIAKAALATKSADGTDRLFPPSKHRQIVGVQSKYAN